MQRQTLKSKVAEKVNRSRKDVFLRADFEKLGNYDQVGRALRQLTEDGALIKISYGIYAKARKNRLTGKAMLAAPGGFTQVATEALKRLGIPWTTSDASSNYESGSTQIPANAQVKVKKRISRTIATDKFTLQVAY